MAYTADELNAKIKALEDVLASGALVVRYSDGRSVTYRSTTEIEDQIKYFRGLLANLTTPPRSRQLAGYASKGLRRG
jgi:hypothetical protein